MRPGIVVLRVVLAALLMAGVGFRVAAEAQVRQPVDVEMLPDGQLAILDQSAGVAIVDPEHESFSLLVDTISGYRNVSLVVHGEPTDVKLYVASVRHVGPKLQVRIAEYDLTGKELRAWPFLFSRSITGLRGDFEKDRLIFVDPRDPAVFALDLTRPEATPDLVGRVFGARALSNVLPSADRLLVSDPARGRVVAVQPDGNTREVAGSLGMPVCLKPLPGSDEVFVLDALNGRVLRVSSDGGASEFGELPDWDYPAAMAVTQEGSVWVVDTRRRSLTLFSPQGEVQRDLMLDELAAR